ncbi:MAG: 1-acyl-sn-glycerol-3-phosphate acyltransferase [Actinobacteria bacterium]|nr:1-acyl-sn-glycerol-3-phosphate acyltransferase [Actinomycetota bacterium]
MLYTIAYLILTPVFKLLYRLEVSGLEHAREDAPAIYAANHKSYLDPIIVGLSLYPRRLNFMAKAELWKIPVLGQVIGGLNAFPVNRQGFDRKAVVKALEILRGGKSMLMFPEGTRIRRPGLGDGLRGVAAIALKANVRVIPVGIVGAGRVMPDGARIPRFPKIKIRFGRPIESADYESDQEGLTRDVMVEIGRLTGCESLGVTPEEEMT